MHGQLWGWGKRESKHNEARLSFAGFEDLLYYSLFTKVRLPHPEKIISIPGRSSLLVARMDKYPSKKRSTSVLNYVSIKRTRQAIGSDPISVWYNGIASQRYFWLPGFSSCFPDILPRSLDSFPVAILSCFAKELFLFFLVVL